MGFLTNIFGRTKKPPRPSAQAVKPRGHAGRDALAGSIRPECKDIADVADQMDTDYQVVHVIGALKANICSVSVTIAAEGVEPQAVALAAHFKNVWDNTLPQMLDAIRLGRVAFEKIMKPDPVNGLEVVDSLDALPFRQTEMLLGPEGRFEGFTLDDDITIPEEKAWWLSLGSTVTEPHGRSLYLGAPFETWKRRNKIDARYDAFMRRLSVKGGTIYCPNTEIDENNIVYDVKEELGAALMVKEAGGYLLLSSELDPSGKFRKYEVAEKSEVLDTAPFIASKVQGETEQVRSFSLPEKTLTEGSSVGSYAMVDRQSLILDALIDSILWQFANSFQKYVIDKTVAMNFPPGARPVITITYPRLAERPDSIISQVVVALLGSSMDNPLVLSGAIDIQKILDEAGIPISDDLAVKLQTFLKVKSAERAQAAQQNAARFGGGGQPAIPFHNLSLEAPPQVPTDDQLYAAVLAEVESIYETFLAAAYKQDWTTAVNSLKELDTLLAEAQTAGMVLGMMKPFRLMPDVVNLAVVAPAAPSVTPPGGRGFIFPFLEKAVQWLIQKDAVSYLEFKLLDENTKRGVLTLPGVNKQPLINQVKLATRRALEEGQSFTTYKETIKPYLMEADTQDYQIKTLFQTAIHGAYSSGFDMIARKPAVVAEFPAIRFIATHDGRTRESHKWLDGKVFLVGSQGYEIAMKALHGWGCRCLEISLDQEQTDAAEIAEYADIPGWVIDDVLKSES